MLCIPFNSRKIQVLSIFVLFLALFFLSGCIEHGRGYCPPAPEGWFSDGTGNNLIVFIDTADNDVGKIVLYTQFFNSEAPNSIDEWTEYDCHMGRPVGGSDCSIGFIMISNYWDLDVVSYEPFYPSCITLSDGEIEVTFNEIPPPP